MATLKEVMRGKSEEGLMDYLNNFNKYTPEAITAAFDELKNRGRIFSEEEQNEINEKIQSRIREEDEEETIFAPVKRWSFKDFRDMFKPGQGYFITPLLLYLNILLFILMVISGGNIMAPDSETLLKWGANFRSLTLAGEWWRLLTNCFLHIGIFHLLLNMYALVYIGLILEPHLGKTRFLAAYLLTGITASIASLWWHDLTISAGASGAIFGMYGVFLALLTTNLLDTSVKKAFMGSIVVFIAFNIVNGLKPDSGIDNAAHIGGLFSGLLIGYAFVPGLKNHENVFLKYASICILAVIVLISAVLVYRTLPNDIGIYDKKMEQFASMESRALKVYTMPEETPGYQVLAELKDSGLYYWNESLKLVESLEDLDLPQPVRERNNKLKEYCTFRIQSYRLIYKAMDEGTDEYEDEINESNRKIEKIISELTGEE